MDANMKGVRTPVYIVSFRIFFFDAFFRFIFDCDGGGVPAP
jgi:hypothetical protein